MRRTILFILMSVCFYCTGFTQERWNKITWQPGVNYHYGFIYPHSDKIEYLIRDHVGGFDFHFAKPCVSENVYDQLFHYPRIGIGIFYADLQNKDVLGSVNSVISFLNAPVYRFSDKSEIDYQIIAGLTYLTQKYDLYENNLNVAIGTHLNLHFTALLSYRIRLLQYFNWSAGISFSHFSNGRVTLPNLGINYISACTGISYNISHKPVIFPERTIPDFNRHNEQILILALGIKQKNEVEDTDHYLIHSLSYDFGRRLQQHIKLSVGTDLFFDVSADTTVEHKVWTDYRLTDLYKLGAHGGFHLTYRNLTMIVMAGGYIFSEFPPPFMIYSRVGLQYKFSDHFLINVTLKSHKAVADFVEWGIGYMFPHK